MPFESIKFQGGINRYRNANPHEPYSLRNARLEPFGVVIGLRAPTSFYPFWDPDNYTLAKGVVVVNRAPYWAFDDTTENTVKVRSRVAGSVQNRAPYWSIEGTASSTLRVDYYDSGSVATYEPVFNLEDGETITIELT